MNRRAFVKVSVASMALGIASKSYAEEATYTWIFVDNMHCQNCANKIARKLYTVPGVVKVQTDVERNFAVVTPQARKQLSPRALWEAVEIAKFSPVKLQGPTGVYTAKPEF